MQTCSSCGASFTGYSYTCPSCKTRETIKEEGEKNRRLSESMARDASAAAQRQASMQREQMDRLEYEQQRAAAQQQAVAEIQIKIEHQKLIELKKQTRFLEEQAISLQDAFDEGYRINSLSSNFFTKSDKNFYFDNPFITTKLNKAYTEGVLKRISNISNDETLWIKPLLVKIEEFAINNRKLLLKVENYLTNKNDGVFKNLIVIYIDGISIDFGIIEVDLRVKIDEHTGDISFEKTKFHEVTNNQQINEHFSLHFDFHNALILANENNKKLYRLESILINKVNKVSSFIEDKKKNNEGLFFNNLRCIIGYLIFVYGIYVLFNAGYWIFNAIPAMIIFGVGAFVIGNNWSFEGTTDLSHEKNSLNELNDLLKKVQNKLDLGEARKDISKVLINKKIIQNPSSSINRKITTSTYFKVILFVSFLLGTLGLIYKFKPEILPISILTAFPVSMPTEIEVFINQKESCDHFLNEPPWDSERKKFLNENIKKYCPSTDSQLEALRKKYSNNKIVSNKLNDYSILGIIETGPSLGKSYEEQRKKLVSSGWNPWKFSQVNNFSGQFPEVMSCDEGFCNSYFINKAGKSILNITYKICGSDYVGTCSGYENDFLMIENYETISIDEAKRQNKIAKDRFE